MLKNLLLPLVVFFFFPKINAQVKHNVQLGLAVGIILDSKDAENLGLFFNVEPKLSVLENAIIGLRIGLVLNSHVFEIEDDLEFFIEEQFDHAVLSFVPTFDYYLSKNNFRPYLGVGLGIQLSPDPIEVFQSANPRAGALEASVAERLGFLFRGGVEYGKFCIGLEYNLISKAAMEIPNGELVGTVSNSYLGLSIGYLFGVGKRLE